MSIPADALAEIFRQNAFISALIGGFSFTLVVILITAPKEKTVTDWTIILAAIAAIGMIVCTLGWTKGAALVAFDAHDSATEWSEHTGWFLKLHQRQRGGRAKICHGFASKLFLPCLSYNSLLLLCCFN